MDLRIACRRSSPFPWLSKVALAALMGAALACSESPAVQKAREFVEQGDRFVAEQKFPEAQAAYRSALVHAPDYVPARIGAGRMEAMTGNLEAAVREFQVALSKEPESSDAYAAWGEALWRAGRFADADEKLRRAQEIEPDSPKIATSRGVTFAALRRDDEALAQFELAAKKTSDFSGSALLFWGAALEHKGRSDEALAKYETAAVADPNDATIQNNLGLMLIRQNKDTARGISLLERAISRNPADANTLANLGWAYVKAERYEEAVDYLGRALSAGNAESQAFARLVENLRLAQSKLTRKAAPERAPNIALVVYDSLRADHLGSYGYERPTSPTLDRLAKESVLFEQVVSQAPWTAASVASIFTGLEPSVHGLDGNRQSGQGDAKSGRATQKALQAANRTLAEILRSNGYRTVGFVSNAHLHSLFGLGQGFDLYRDILATGPDKPKSSRRAAETNALVSEWLGQPVEEPFFLFVHYDDPNVPYDPPAPFGDEFIKGYRGRLTPHTTPRVVERQGKPITTLTEENLRYLVGLYDGEIQYADAQLAALLQRLRSAKLQRPLVTVVTADHGEEFLDHGSASNGWTLFDEQIRVPLVVHFPGQLAARRIPQQVQLVDVAPTLLELAGIAAPEARMQGESFAALARGAAKQHADHAFSEAALSGEWKSIRAADGTKLIRNVVSGKTLLFDTAKDPREKTDLAADPASAERREALASALAQHLERSRALRAELRQPDGDTDRLALGQPAGEPMAHPGGEN